MLEEKSPDDSLIKKRRYTNAALRQSHVNQWRQSGLTMREYCREHNITLSCFSSWVQAHKLAKQTFKPIAVRASVETPLKQPTVIEILISDKLKIRLIDVISASIIADIAKELMRCN